MIKSAEIQRPYPLGHGGRLDQISTMFYNAYAGASFIKYLKSLIIFLYITLRKLLHIDSVIPVNLYQISFLSLVLNI